MSHQWLDNTSARAFRAAKLRYFFIIGSIVVIAIACISLVIYQQNQKNKLAKIAKEYAVINALYYQENLQVPDTPSNSLEAPKPTANHAKSMDLFSQFARAHAKEPYGWQAGIRAGNYDINQGNIQAAKELFEIIIPNTSKFPLIQIKLGMALAGIYAEQNDAPKALQQLENIQKIQGNPIPDETKLFHAQILYVFGKSDEARQMLNTLNSEEAKIWLSYIEA